MKTVIKILLLFFAICITSCENEESLINPESDLMLKGLETNPQNKVTLCHHDQENNTWHLITVDYHAVPAHLQHGDVVIDKDGDGICCL